MHVSLSTRPRRPRSLYRIHFTARGPSGRTRLRIPRPRSSARWLPGPQSASRAWWAAAAATCSPSTDRAPAPPPFTTPSSTWNARHIPPPDASVHPGAGNVTLRDATDTIGCRDKEAARGARTRNWWLTRRADPRRRHAKHVLTDATAINGWCGI